MDEQQLSNLKNELSKIRDNIGQVYSQDSNNQTKEEISNELQSSWRKFKELLQDAPIENKDILLDELGADFFNGLSDRCVTDRADNFIMILEGYISGIQTHLNEKDYDTLNQSNIRSGLVSSIEEYGEDRSSEPMIETYREEAYYIIRKLGTRIDINPEDFIMQYKTAFDRILEHSHENINELLKNDRVSLINEIENLLPESEKEAFKNSLKEGAPTLEQQEEDSKKFMDSQKNQDDSKDIKPLNTDFKMI